MWRLLSVLVVGIWLALIAMLVTQRSAAPPHEVSAPVGAVIGESWAGIYQGAEKIGFTRSAIQPDAGGYRFIEESTLRMKVLDQPQLVLVRANGRVDDQLNLTSFEFELGGSAVAMRASGSLDAGALVVQTEMGSQKSTLRIPQEQRVSFPAVLRSGLRGKQLRPGNRVSAAVFDPMTMTAKQMSFEVERREALPKAADGAPMAWRVRALMGEMQSVMWLDDDGALLREEAPMGFVMLRESAEVAVNAGWGSGAGPDVARNAAVPASSKIGNPRTRESLHLRLRGHAMAIPESPEQEVAGEEITLRRATLQATNTFELPYRGEALKASLAASSFVQVDHPKIRAAAAAIAGKHTDAQSVARALNRWVFENLDKVPTVSMPNAVQVLERGEGDCNEHAVLFMALSRAAGIPTRLAAGLVYVDGAFLYHAWNEVWLGRWLPIDSALGQFPVDATHIKLADGEIDAMFAVVQSVGRMSIDVSDSNEDT